MSTGPILVTGFEPFAGHAENPSEGVVRALCAEAELVTEVLPVSYERAERRMARLLDELHPAAVLLLGRQDAQALSLERVATNLDDDPSPDEDGVVRQAAAIRPGGPAAYWSSLPLRRIGDALDRLGLPWQWSSHAGGFLCNHVFYVVRHHLEKQGRSAPSGFVHLPPADTIPLATQLIAARACLEALGESLDRGSQAWS
ncbi:MAG: pyrrolidone-carboxylate peptidase [Myxococcota bacterium]|nr:pyrrolidone-carboxylate peptidase [Myxococcota bacterium]